VPGDRELIGADAVDGVIAALTDVDEFEAVLLSGFPKPLEELTSKG
jgi:hypothetical protein